MDLLKVLGKNGDRRGSRSSLSRTNQDNGLIIRIDHLIQVNSTRLQISQQHITSNRTLLATTTKSVTRSTKDDSLISILLRNILSSAIDKIALLRIITNSHQIDDSLVTSCTASDYSETKHSLILLIIVMPYQYDRSDHYQYQNHEQDNLHNKWNANICKECYQP